MQKLTIADNNNIDRLYQAIEAGKTVYWGNESYQLFIENARADNQYQLNHFTYRNGKVLAARCISNYFGSLLNESDLGRLFIK